MLPPGNFLKIALQIEPFHSIPMIIYCVFLAQTQPISKGWKNVFSVNFKAWYFAIFTPTIPILYILFDFGVCIE